VDLKFKTSLWDARSQTYISTPYRGTVSLWARPPSPITALTEATAKITVQINATNFHMTVAGGQLDEKGNVVPGNELGSFDNPTGRVEATVPNADRFCDNEGRFVFVLLVDKLRKDAEKRDFTMAKATSWKLDGIQIDLKGTVR
jgi:hypothetical protein